MLDTQGEIDDALSRTTSNDTVDMTELETELEELLKQPIPIPSPPVEKELIPTRVPEVDDDPFADLELRLKKLGVRERKSFWKYSTLDLGNFRFLAPNKVAEIAPSN